MPAVDICDPTLDTCDGTQTTTGAYNDVCGGVTHDICFGETATDADICAPTYDMYDVCGYVVGDQDICTESETDICEPSVSESDTCSTYDADKCDTRVTEDDICTTNIADNCAPGGEGGDPDVCGGTLIDPDECRAGTDVCDSGNVDECKSEATDVCQTTPSVQEDECSTTDASGLFDTCDTLPDGCAVTPTDTCEDAPADTCDSTPTDTCTSTPTDTCSSSPTDTCDTPTLDI